MAVTLEEMAQIRARIARHERQARWASLGVARSRASSRAVHRPLFMSLRSGAEIWPERKRGQGLLGLVLMVVGLVLVVGSLGFWGYSRYVAWQLDHLMAGAVVMPVEAAPLAPAVAPVEAATEAMVGGGEAERVVERVLAPPTRLWVPSIELEAPVKPVGTRVENGQVVWEMAAHAVGHYTMTAVPRQGGNIVMAGHISSPFRGEGSVFRRLPEVLVGDVVYVEAAGVVYPYEVVRREVVAPTAVEVMGPTEGEMLTLITCYPDLVYSHRLVVRAVPLKAAE